jgi:hypothetical protein
MGRFLELLLTPGQFLPHGLCLSWRPELIWTHLISDVLIGLAYFSIPIGLGYFVWKRQDLAFKGFRQNNRSVQPQLSVGDSQARSERLDSVA